ncbi:MAG: NnrS family protein, partial [Rhodospirillaceae bacterium]|nr:NnrS family protein [Rhodospirillaceae bacterium]
MLARIVELPTEMDPVAWHVHEILFGFVAAAMAGFLLTAVPGWTGRPPLRGLPLAALAALWLAGRVAVALSAWIGAAAAAV